MKVISKISEMRSAVRSQKSNGKKIGFVPTMGFLHEGHLSLVRESVQRTDCTVVSVFVNPTQFGPGEDFQEYPRDLEKDKALLRDLGVDYVFIPDDQEMYPEGFKTFVEVKDLQDKYEGQSRPGHFRGVCTVVLKLFMIIEPDVAHFGQKDAQQAVIVKKMARDLNLDVKIQVLPTVREKDGLALSSRNIYLSQDQRKAALCLVNSLRKAKNMIEAGETNPHVVANEIQNMIAEQELAALDYVAIVNLENFENLDTIDEETLIAVAVYFGKIRLLDNIIVGNKN